MPLVPLFVEQQNEESVDDALARTKFQDIWDVLAAMLEQDVAFVETIRRMREERGRTGEFDDGLFRELIEVIGEEVSLDTIRRFVTVASVDRFGASWDERFGELVAYKEKYGHFKVSRKNPETRTLATWVIFQRQQRRKGELSDERTKRLDEIGFDWRASGNRKDAWNTRIQQMKEYKQRFGDCNVPANWNENRKLGIWVVNARAQRKKGRLSQERVETLDELGFDWELRQRKVRRLDSDELYRQLVDFKNTHGHIRQTKEMDDQLGRWIPEPYPGDPYVHNTFKQFYSDHHPVVFRLVGTGVDDD